MKVMIWNKRSDTAADIMTQGSPTIAPPGSPLSSSATTSPVTHAQQENATGGDGQSSRSRGVPAFFRQYQAEHRDYSLEILLWICILLLMVVFLRPPIDRSHVCTTRQCGDPVHSRQHGGSPRQKSPETAGLSVTAVAEFGTIKISCLGSRRDG